MKVQLLPSTIDEDGQASQRQHLLTMIIDDALAIDAGCLAFSCTDLQRQQVRDIILTHTHLDHVAGLPIFVDDMFASLTEPIVVHATAEMVDILETHLFNWALYPRFSELKNSNCNVLEYRIFDRGSAFDVGNHHVKSCAVNHKVSANGYIISRGNSSIAVTGDTAQTDEIWQLCNETENLSAVFVECAFPNSLADLAMASDHLTPERLAGEIAKLKDRDHPVYVINLKSMYREVVIKELGELAIDGLEVLEVGRVYDV
jgi:cAMP phosphodiesterase